MDSGLAGSYKGDSLISRDVCEFAEVNFRTTFRQSQLGRGSLKGPSEL